MQARRSVRMESHAEALRPVTNLTRSRGAVPGIQLAHGGRKSALFRPWEGNAPGCDVIEGHFAQGHLLHSSLSPLNNKRTDQSGGSLENRSRFPLMVAQALKAEWPSHLAVLIRISAVDWREGGVTLDESVQVGR